MVELLRIRVQYGIHAGVLRHHHGLAFAGFDDDNGAVS
ncbi:hypothetical protein M2260_003404 [Rhodococcus erythropolis]|nr:hypothetical protein [Rhodococcus erythropolis]